MPTYNFTNHKTKKKWQEFMSISERTKLLEENPDITQDPCAPLIHSGRGIGQFSKPDNGFRDVLRNIKKIHGVDGRIETKINTF